MRTGSTASILLYAEVGRAASHPSMGGYVLMKSIVGAIRRHNMVHAFLTACSPA